MKGQQMAAEMAEQPEVLARLAERAVAQVEAVRTLLPRPLAATVFLARGSSDNAAVYGRYLAELASGRPSGLAAPSLYTRYRAQVDWRGCLVVALSQSGATPEIVTTCRAMRAAGAVTVGITNDANSELSSIVDLVLSTDAGAEVAIPATKTVTAQMLLVMMVAEALGSVEVTPEQLLMLSAAVQSILADPLPIDRLARRWAHVDRLIIAGRGLGYAAALECALKVKETTGILAEGISTADLRHGPIATVYAGAPVLLVDTGGPVAADLDELRQLLTDRHADVVTLPLGPSLPEPLQVIAAVVRGQQLARDVALMRGADPDAPEKLSKVTLTA
jgi:glucosamine--fructose-6-phosphate aminotransferase (isomerizing)